MGLSHPQLPLSLPLRETSSFDSFLPGPNALLVASLKAVAGGGERQLYLWGGAGSGRSHLAEAVVRQGLQAGEPACLLTGQELLRTRPAVLEGLEDMALIVVDDIDALAGRGEWEEGLFHLYNRMVAQSNRMVFAACHPPRGAGFVLPDLSSRLAAGPVFHLQSLDDEALVTLLRKRAESRGLMLAEDVARFVVTRSPRSPAGLMAQLECLDRGALVHKRRLTLPFVREVLGLEGITKL